MVRSTIFWLWVTLGSGLLGCSSGCSDGKPRLAIKLPSDPTGLIAVDQFGYLPDAQKVAVIRDPQVGFDAQYQFAPGPVYHLEDADSGERVFSGVPVAWNGGAVAEASGDRVWHFDFSSVSTPGAYVVVDELHGVRSPRFRIAANVYRPVLVHAMRTFFYQRAGFAKHPPYAEPGWQDGASHMGPLQDAHARLYSDDKNPATERDLQGGWYDAGDYNKYTHWHADYLLALLHAYRENPSAWTDDFNIPESGNGIADILNEVKWGMDWLLRMQEPDGSVLSVMGLSHASPPSSATGASVYGPATTAASHGAAAAFAFGSKIFSEFPVFKNYAAQLQNAAVLAWTWAEENPDVTFFNTGLVAAGEQEFAEDYGRLIKRLTAAIYLYDTTGDAAYRTVVEQNYIQVNMMDWQHVYVFEADIQHALLYFSQLPGVTTNVAARIRSVYRTALAESEEHWLALQAHKDAYRAPLQAYTWGSNRSKAQQGNIFYDQLTFGIGNRDAEEVRNAALRYLNYLHGVNPLGKVYLSNMGSAGAHNAVDRFYHSWFAPNGPWDSVSESAYGPAPGFLVGGPNPDYEWDACCPASCGRAQNNARCAKAMLSPPAGQPAQKSYRDFNDSWPINSWSVTENHNSYQVHYLRLLSKFVAD